MDEILQEVYRTFKNNNSSSSLVQTLQKGSSTFLGVRCDLEGQVDLRNLRQTLLELMNLEDTGILQVVGDSGVAFDERAIPQALQRLVERAESKVIIEYGYTAIQYDANWIVNEYMRRSPEAGLRVLANIVEQTIQCTQDPTWECSMEVTKFVALYTGDRGTNFGEDVWLSDGIMFADCGDRMLCFEGGLQAFRQCVNVLSKGIEVIAVTGLRSKSNRGRFSAAQLLCLLKTIDISEVEAQVDHYLRHVFGGDFEQIDRVRDILYLLIRSTCSWKAFISSS